MDFLLWSVLFLTFIAMISGAIYLAYHLPRKLLPKEAGEWLSGILLVGLFLIVLAFVLEDEFFFESDAREMLREHHIVLRDNFEIVSNRSGGFTDYFHRFELAITANDKERIINRIKSAKNFRDKMEDGFDIRMDNPRYSTTETFFTANYQNELYYVFEYYKPDKPGYSPTWDRIFISKTENRLNFDRVFD